MKILKYEEMTEEQKMAFDYAEIDWNDGEDPAEEVVELFKEMGIITEAE